MKSRMTTRGSGCVNRLSRPLGVLFTTAMCILSAACIGGKTPYMIEQYTVEYPAPLNRGDSPMNVTMRVERFSASKAYSGQAMVYSSGPFKMNSYDYHRWRVSPGDMVTDFLLRDLRGSGLFRAVFSYHDPEEARFVLEGGVEEFLESDGKDGAKAILGLSVTLLDATQREVTKRVVFQRRYRFVEAMGSRDPQALVQSMSRAMEMFSKALLEDVEAAVKESIRTP